MPLPAVAGAPPFAAAVNTVLCPTPSTPTTCCRRATGSKSSLRSRAADATTCHDLCRFRRHAGALRPDLHQPPAAGHLALPVAQRAEAAAAAAPSPAMLTASLRRQAATRAESGQQFLGPAARRLNVPVLPNTAGCHSVQEAITTAHMAREVFNTPWIKLEADWRRLHPAARHPEPGRSRRAVDQGRLQGAALLHRRPGAVPAPGRRGLPGRHALGRTHRHRAAARSTPMRCACCASAWMCRCWWTPGLGLPSHACQVMEWGFDGVLLNTAVALAQDPVRMAGAFADADAERGALLAMPAPCHAQHSAQPSTPVLGTPFWHHAPV